MTSKSQCNSCRHWYTAFSNDNSLLMLCARCIWSPSISSRVACVFVSSSWAFCTCVRYLHAPNVNFQHIFSVQRSVKEHSLQLHVTLLTFVKLSDVRQKQFKAAMPQQPYPAAWNYLDETKPECLSPRHGIELCGHIMLGSATAIAVRGCLKKGQTHSLEKQIYCARKGRQTCGLPTAWSVPAAAQG